MDISKDEKQILIQDFKTGNIKWNSLNGDMSRQLFIYYLVLKNKFPSGMISATYREIKDINNFGYNSGFIIEDSLQDFPELKIKKSKRHIIISDIEEIFKQILNCFQPIVDSNFPLFSKFNTKINLDSYYYLKAVSRLESIKFTLLNN